MRTRITAALLAVAALVATAPPAAAAPQPPDTSLTWSVSPSGPKGPNGRPALDYKLDPGATVTDHVAVTNHSRRPLTLRLSARDAFTTAGGGFDLRAGRTAPVDAGAWIKLDRTTVTLPKSSRIIIAFTVTVPADATPGDHAAGVVASLTADGTDAAGRQVTVDHRVGTRLHVRVTGPLRPAFSITDVRIATTTPWHPLRMPEITATFAVRNTGNVRLTGQPSARAHGPFGLGRRTAAALSIPEILPGGTVRTSVRIASVPPLFRAHLAISVQPATVDGRTLDPAPVRAQSERTVRLIPWPQLALLALAAALVTGWMLRRRRHKRRLAEAVAAAEERGRAQARTADPSHG
jgi:hypothetical protein